VLLQINCNDYKSVVGVCFVFYVRSIRDQSITDACSSNITRLPLFMPMTCRVFFFWKEEGDRVERKGER
jgi:hypothetical protein